MSERPVVWKPQPKQEVALTCPADEAFYGGAAGGGKSDFLLMDYVKGIGYGAGWKGVLFRKSYPELEELESRSLELYPRIGGVYKQSKHIWTFPGGATLKMRYLEKNLQVHVYQGHQYTWIGWDELTLWADDYCYQYLKSRNRSAEGLPCYIRAAGNPGGPGHAWVKFAFIDETLPNTIVQDAEGLTKAFIPASVYDNHILVKNDEKYLSRLKGLPSDLRRALLDGDWDVFSGQVFSEFKRSRHVVTPFQMDPGWKRFACMDWGYTKPFSIGWYAVTPDGRAIRYREYYGCEKDKMNTGLKLGAEKVAKRAWLMSVAEGCSEMVADPAIWSRQDDAPTIAQKFEAAGWTMIKANNDRVTGLNQMHDLMQEEAEDGRPRLLVFSTNMHFLRTIPALTYSLTRVEDVNTDQEDHIYDETRYAMMSKFMVNPERVSELKRRPVRKKYA